MHAIYIVTTCLTAAMNGYAASLNFRGDASVKVVADRVRVPRSWMVPLGTLLALGATGLLAGIAVPPVGTAAAGRLTVYFLCAMAAHLRTGDKRLGGAAFFWLLAAGSLVASLVDSRSSVID